MLYIYLDESGDMGLDFTNKNPSRYFTITILVVKGKGENRKLINAVKKTIKRKLNPRRKRKRFVEELKGADTTMDVKKYLYRLIEEIDFEIYAITLDKKRLFNCFVKNKSDLYNFISRKLLGQIPLKDAKTRIELIVDKSKNKPGVIDFNKYIRVYLEGRIEIEVPLDIYHLDSKENKGLQVVDMFSSGIFKKHERNKCDWFNIFKEKVKYDIII